MSVNIYNVYYTYRYMYARMLVEELWLSSLASCCSFYCLNPFNQSQNTTNNHDQPCCDIASPRCRIAESLQQAPFPAAVSFCLLHATSPPAVASIVAPAPPLHLRCAPAPSTPLRAPAVREWQFGTPLSVRHQTSAKYQLSSGQNGEANHAGPCAATAGSGAVVAIITGIVARRVDRHHPPSTAVVVLLG